MLSGLARASSYAAARLRAEPEIFARYLSSESWSVSVFISISIFHSRLRIFCSNSFRRSPSASGYRRRRHEINTVRIDLDDSRAVCVEPLNHLLKQIAPDLRHTRGSVEVGKMSLRESEIAVETVQQNFKRVLQRLKMVLLGG